MVVHLHGPSAQIYISAKQKIKGLKAINDFAEHAVKLATDYNIALTYDETQWRLIYQIVEYHRKHVAKPLKQNF